MALLCEILRVAVTGIPEYRIFNEIYNTRTHTSSYFHGSGCSLNS